MVGRLGRYELHDVVGTGGFATVYRATDPSLQGVVAVKVLADNWSRDPAARRRFRAEAVLLRRAQSAGSVPGLVEVYDIDEDEAGQPFFVMAYADRGTLAERARGARWSGADVVAVIDALAETVGALHENDIVHRDLKPTNVLIRSDGRAATRPGRLILPDERLLVADLGLARDLRRDDEPVLCRRHPLLHGAGAASGSRARRPARRCVRGLGDRRRAAGPRGRPIARR